MKIVRKVRGQLANVTLIKASSLRSIIKRSFRFPIDYYLKKGRCSFPTNITMHITFRCNLKCEMCFFKELATQKYDELSFSEIQLFVDQIKSEHPGIYLTGGEPFLRKDLFEIVKYIKLRGLNVGINTNGTLLNSEKIEKLLAVKPDYVIFSIDGPEEIHDKIRGGGVFQKAIANIQKITKYDQKSRPKVFMNTVMSGSNIDSLDEIVRIAKETKVDAVFLQHVSFLTEKDIAHHNTFCQENFKNEETTTYYSYDIGDDNLGGRILDAAKRITKLAAEEDVKLLIMPDLNEEETSKWYQDVFSYTGACISPWNTMLISPSGDVTPCPLSYSIKMGNVRDQAPQEIWNSQKFISFRRLLKEKKMFPGCNRCCKS